MQLGVADGSGRVLIDLDKDMLCLVNHGRGIRTDGTEAEITVLVHRRNRNTESVIVVVGSNMTGAVAVIVGNIVCIAAVNGCARRCAGKPGSTGNLAEQTVILNKRMRIAFQHVMDLDAGEPAGSGTAADSVDDGGGLGNSGVHADQPVVSHLGGDLVSSHFLLAIENLIICHHISSQYIPPKGG